MGIIIPIDIGIPGWGPVGSVLPYWEKVPLQPWLAPLLVMLSKKKVPNGVDVLLPQRNPSFGLVKTESDFVVRLVETGLGRWMLVASVISVKAYPFLIFSDLTCHLEDTGIFVF